MILFLKKNKNLWNRNDVHMSNQLRLKSLKEKGDEEDAIMQRRIAEAEEWASTSNTVLSEE